MAHIQDSLQQRVMRYEKGGNFFSREEGIEIIAAYHRGIQWMQGNPVDSVEKARDLAKGIASNASSIDALVGRLLQQLKGAHNHAKIDPPKEDILYVR